MGTPPALAEEEPKRKVQLISGTGLVDLKNLAQFARGLVEIQP
jgi:hypothetical protein